MADKNKNKVNREYEDANLTNQEKEALSAAQAAMLRENDKKLLEDQEKEKEKEEKNKKLRKKLTLLAIILFILLLLARCSVPIDIFDNDVPKINMDFEQTVDQEQLDFDVIDEDYDGRYSMLTISMNYYPVFEDGLSEGTLNIINDAKNVYAQFIEIYIDGADGQPDMTQKIYTSNLIDIGQALPKDKLDVNLPAGNYDCTAFFNGVLVERDEEGNVISQSLVGKAAAKLHIAVMNTRVE